MKCKLSHSHISSIKLLPSPFEIKTQFTLSDLQRTFITESRKSVADIVEKKDSRLLVVVGPCSVHDHEAAFEYAEKLKTLASKVKETLFLVMRVYFEKPRSMIGWKGILHDPEMNGNFELEKGLRLTREMLLSLADLGMPAGTEFLDPAICHYVSDTISWGCIGARTSESQIHRQLASGLAMPVGFKNSTDGNIESAINAIISATIPHAYIGLSEMGQSAVIHTTGNPYTHIVLRGGGKGPNYDANSLERCISKLKHHKLPERIMIDCAHDNSKKDHFQQVKVFEEIVAHVKQGNKNIIGLQLESHLYGGSQNFTTDPQSLHYGVSITDPCLDWDSTEDLLLRSHKNLIR